MSRARARSVVLALILVAALGACDGGAYLHVTLDSRQPVSVTALDVSLTSDGEVGRATLERAFALPPSHDFVVGIPTGRRGTMKLDVVARSGAVEVGRAGAVVTVTGAGTTTLRLELQPTTSSPVDLGSADLVAAVDQAAAAVDQAPRDDLPTATDLAAADLRTPDLQREDLQVVDLRGLDLRADDLLAADLRTDDQASDLLAADLRTDDQASDLLAADLLGPPDMSVRTLGLVPGASLAPTGLGWIALGELDGLGGIDLVYVDDDGVFWHAGNGDRTFAATANPVPGMTATAPSGFARVAAGQLNGDGFLDLVATRRTGDPKVYRAITTAQATFAQPTPLDVGPEPFGLQLGNANLGVVGDNGLDLFVTSKDVAVVQPLRWVTGKGDGDFDAPLAFDSGVDPVAIAVGDVNGDGRSDVAVACIGTSALRTPGVYVQRTDASGLSSSQVVLAAAGDAPLVDVALGQLNGDGKLDVVAACPSCGKAILFAAKPAGDGTFEAAVELAVGDLNQPRVVAVGDVDGDGRLDVVVGGAVGSPSTGGIAVLIGNGDGSFQAPTASERFLLDRDVLQIVIADLDGNLLPEVLVVTSSGLVVLDNTSHF